MPGRIICPGEDLAGRSAGSRGRYGARAGRRARSIEDYLGRRPRAISVRDPASHYQLAWQPVPEVGVETTITVLASLFWEHGSPLVLKSDNGSASIA